MGPAQRARGEVATLLGSEDNSHSRGPRLVCRRVVTPQHQEIGSPQSDIHEVKSEVVVVAADVVEGSGFFRSRKWDRSRPAAKSRTMGLLLLQARHSRQLPLGSALVAAVPSWTSRSGAVRKVALARWRAAGRSGGDSISWGAAQRRKLWRWGFSAGVHQMDGTRVGGQRCRSAQDRTSQKLGVSGEI